MLVTVVVPVPVMAVPAPEIMVLILEKTTGERHQENQDEHFLQHAIRRCKDRAVGRGHRRKHNGSLIRSPNLLLMSNQGTAPALDRVRVCMRKKRGGANDMAIYSSMNARNVHEMGI